VSAAPSADQIRWPAPPYAVERLAVYRRVAGWVLVVMAGGILLGLTVGFFSVHDGARNLLIDTAASLGLGAKEADSRVEAERCNHRGGGYQCRLIIHRRAPSGAMERIAIDAEFHNAADVARLTEVRRVFGVVALRWPAGILLRQWLELWVLLIPLAFAGFIYWIAHALLREDYLKHRAGRDGLIVSADLLFHDQVWRFAYRDRRGRQRFGKGDGGTELRLDGVVTKGAALVARNGRAWLLQDSLWPLQLPADQIAAVREQETALRGQPRPRLRPIDGEPREPAERLAAIRDRIGKDADIAQLHRAYLLAWRLTWDYFDADTAHDAMTMRNQAGARLGPSRALEALEEARRSVTPQSA
jgi:hypothetical protein